MSVHLSFHTFASGQPDFRPSMPLPIVYENVVVTPPTWEYRVLTIDTSERALPDAAYLNEFGQEGWLLTGMLVERSHKGSYPSDYRDIERSLTGIRDERISGGGELVHYYFVRQKADS